MTMTSKDLQATILIFLADASGRNKKNKKFPSYAKPSWISGAVVRNKRIETRKQKT